MISILIMEDQEEKISAMKSLLVDECNIPEEAIDVAKNIFDGRLLLQEKIYDLLLLDMVLPARADLEPNEDDSPKLSLHSFKPAEKPVMKIVLGARPLCQEKPLSDRR